MAELYNIDDVVASCMACGAYSLTRNPKKIEHYPSCGGLAEIEKWEEYYSDPEWEKAITGGEDGD